MGVGLVTGLFGHFVEAQDQESFVSMPVVLVLAGSACSFVLLEILALVLSVESSVQLVVLAEAQEVDFGAASELLESTESWAFVERLQLAFERL